MQTALPSIRPPHRASRVAGIAATMLVLATLLPGSVHARVVRMVSNVGDLYSAVNAVENQGALVLLNPGTYPLVPGGVNGGRLELQPGMTLQGLAGAPALTVIDATRLSAGNYSVELDAGTTGKTGAIRTGRGDNALIGLTVQNAINGASAITTDLVAPGPAHLSLVNVVVSGSPRGLDARNFGSRAQGRVLQVDVTNSVFRDNLGSPGQGIRIANISTTDASIRVKLAVNHVNNNLAGCLAANLNTSDSTIEIQSAADDFSGNGNGCVLLAGARQPATPGGPGVDVTGNLLTFNASTSRFDDNTLLPSPSFPQAGGILAVAGQNNDGNGITSDNALTVTLAAVHMSGNNGTDLKAWGVYSAATPPAPVGTDNTAMLTLLATTGSSQVVGNVPELAGSGNQATIVRH
jgi:hypothetical protein